MANTPIQKIRVGPIRMRLPQGAEDTTRAVYGDARRRVEISRFEDPAESPEDYSRTRQARAAEVAGTGPAREESLRVDGQPAHLTIYAAPKDEPGAKGEGERAFLVLALRPRRFALIQFSGPGIAGMRAPMVSSIRIGPTRKAERIPGLGEPEDFGDFSMAFPEGFTRRTAVAAEDAVAGIRWRMDATEIGRPEMPPMTRRLPRPPELEAGAGADTRQYGVGERSGAITTRRVTDPETGAPGGVVGFAAVVVSQRVLVHVRGDCPVAQTERLQGQMLELLDSLELEETR